MYRNKKYDGSETDTIRQHEYNAELLMKISEITKKGYNHKDLELNFDFDEDGETIRCGNI